jgi:hypothetical protein
MSKIVPSDGKPGNKQELMEHLLRKDIELGGTDDTQPCAGAEEEWPTSEVELVKRMLLELESSETEEPRRFVGEYELINEIGRAGNDLLEVPA